MKCTACGKDVAAESIICPHCDHVLDASAFDAEPPETDEDDEVDAAPSPVASARAVRRGHEPEPSFGQRSPEDMLGDVRDFVRELPFFERMSLAGSVTALVACFLPWKDTLEDGDVLGVFSSGFASFALTVGSMVLLVLRAQGAVPTLPRAWLFLGQLGGNAGAGLWALICIKTAWNPTMTQALVGNYMRPVSTPSVGVFLTVLASIAAVLGGVLSNAPRSR